MAKGPFGNPLSTGIALSGVIDMVTPVRQAQERKRKRQAEEKAAQDNRAKELGSIMGKIAIDEDKIWWRYHDDARSQYANTIDKVQQMYSAGDYAGMYKTINDFDSSMANYTQATTQKNEWKKSVEKGDKYYDQNYLNQLENRDFDMKDLASLADQSGFGMYDENTNILGFINPTDRVDLRASMKKAVEGQKFEYDKVGKKLDVVGYGANREPVYRMSLQDKDNTINAVKNSISPQAVPYMLMELGYSKEDQIKMTPAELAQTLDQELDKVYGLYATQEQMGSKPAAPKENKGWSFGGGGAKSPNWEVNKVSNIPVSLTDEVGGSLSGWKVDYIKQTGQKELQRSVELGKGAYFAEGGKKIHKISDSATGMGMVIEATPAGIYVRDDKKGGQVWAAYETNYMPPKDDLMKNFKFDPKSSLTEAEQKQVHIDLSIESDKDMISETKRIVYVPLSSENEKIEFRTAMGMSSDEFNKLLKEIGASPSTGSSSNVTTQAEFDAAWAKLKPGEKLTSPDGTTVYTKQ
jgi:hypothetical protein